MRPHRFPAVGWAAAALILAGCIAAALTVAAEPAVAAPSTTSPPVIREHFTVRRCPRKPRTTVQIEGCAEHRVIALDKRIDALNAKIFARLGKAGRAVFLKTNADWVGYRDAACATEASIYSGGSLQPVAYANCLISIDSSHGTELKGMLAALSPAG